MAFPQWLVVLGVTSTLWAQRGPQGPQVISPEVQADRRVTFRILAPKA